MSEHLNKIFETQQRYVDLIKKISDEYDMNIDLLFTANRSPAKNFYTSLLLLQEKEYFKSFEERIDFLEKLFELNKKVNDVDFLLEFISEELSTINILSNAKKNFVSDVSKRFSQTVRISEGEEISNVIRKNKKLPHIEKNILIALASDSPTEKEIYSNIEIALAFLGVENNKAVFEATTEVLSKKGFFNSIDNINLYSEFSHTFKMVGYVLEENELELLEKIKQESDFGKIQDLIN